MHSVRLPELQALATTCTTPALVTAYRNAVSFEPGDSETNIIKKTWALHKRLIKGFFTAIDVGISRSTRSTVKVAYIAGSFFLFRFERYIFTAHTAVSSPKYVFSPRPRCIGVNGEENFPSYLLKVARYPNFYAYFIDQLQNIESNVYVQYACLSYE